MAEKTVIQETVVKNASPQKKKHLALNFLFINGLILLTLNIIQIVYLAEETKSSLRKDFIDTCQQITYAHSWGVANRIAAYEREMHMYSRDNTVQTGTRDEIVSHIRANTADRSKDFDYIMYAESDGMAYTDTGTQTDIHDRSYFTAVMQDGKDDYIDNPVISRTTGLPVFHVAQAVKRGGKTYAVVVGVIQESFLSEVTSGIKFGKTGYAWILAGDGTVLAHPVTDYVMKKNFITGLSKGHEDMAAIATRMTKGETGYGNIHGLHGGYDLISFSPIPGTPWSFAISVEDAQVNAVATRLTRSMIWTITVILLGIVLSSGIYLLRSLKPLQVVGDTITGIASGTADLTKRIPVKSSNEIGQVVDGFNAFSGKMQMIVIELKKSKDILTTAGEDLHASTQDTSASINQILTNIESMNNHITNQSAGVEETAGAVNEIASNIQSLEHMIETQAAGVTEASAAVEQMIGNINSVNQSVEKMADSFVALEQNATDGASKQQDVNERIEQIENESDMLQEANTAIANIASQTNLLAMNAAIEAAHAGEAGKGFSVVADEIRKLSETSTAQSKTIGNQLNKIKESINSVVSASADSSAAFNSVAEGIRNTDELVRQIKGAMQEQQEGSKQINNALHSMNDSTTEVKTASTEMSAGNQAILEEVKNLQDATMNMKESMNEMRTGARRINETGAALTEIAQKMKDSIGSIGNQIDQFKV